MKFMKLGSKPDVLHRSSDNCIRFGSSELATDVIINVGKVKFYLHKFPLLSKSNHLHRLVSKAKEEQSGEINLVDFPGDSRAFEICAKFCYGMTVTLNPNNVVATRCAAEYLEMTEDVDRGNLIFKIEIFLNSSIFRSWKDSILVLRSTKSLLPWAEDLKIVGRCVDSIGSKSSMAPAKVTWSYTYNRKLAAASKITEIETNFPERESVPKDWWVEDVCELDVDHFKRIIIAIKSKGRMDEHVIGEALRTYAGRWLPNSVDDLISSDHAQRNKDLLETLISLLPCHRGVGCACSFLLKLLRFAILLGSDDSIREDLVKKIALKLDEASVSDLLIPSVSPQITTYDVELVQRMVKLFVMHEKCIWDSAIMGSDEKGTGDVGLENESLLKVGKLVDGFLAMISTDPDLALTTFIQLSLSVPESARPIHDGLYRAIDVFLKEHPNLTKAERKKICGLMDVRKLSTDASSHATQNERLPLRIAIQVLFFEQAKVAAEAQSLKHLAPMINLEEEWDKPVLESCRSLRKQLSRISAKGEENGKCEQLLKKKSTRKDDFVRLLPSRSRRILDRLWAVGKANGENKSSETSGSSRSPISLGPGETKSSSSSSRNRRHSIS